MRPDRSLYPGMMRSARRFPHPSRSALSCQAQTAIKAMRPNPHAMRIALNHRKDETQQERMGAGRSVRCIHIVERRPGTKQGNRGVLPRFAIDVAAWVALRDIRPLRFGASIACGVLLSACAGSPLSDYDLNVPAQTLRVTTAPAVADGRTRFREIFCAIAASRQAADAEAVACENFLLRLSDEAAPLEIQPSLPEADLRLRVILVGGLLSDCVHDLAALYMEASQALRERGYQVELIPVGGLSSSRRNAQQIAAFVSRLDLQPDEKLVLIGHSKGAIDILQFLVDFPDSRETVVAVASIAGAINGSPLADWVGESARPWLGWVPESWCTPGDSGALDDLERSKRMDWWLRNRLPDSVRYFSVVAFTRLEEAAWPLRETHGFLSYVDPRNDGQLIFYDQVIPGGTLLGYANTDHWGVALPLEFAQSWLALRPEYVRPFPRTALLEAVLLYIAEDLRRTSTGQGEEAAP